MKNFIAYLLSAILGISISLPSAANPEIVKALAEFTVSSQVEEGKVSWFTKAKGWGAEKLRAGGNKLKDLDAQYKEQIAELTAQLESSEAENRILSIKAGAVDRISRTADEQIERWKEDFNLLVGAKQDAEMGYIEELETLWATIKQLDASSDEWVLVPNCRVPRTKEEVTSPKEMMDE